MIDSAIAVGAALAGIAAAALFAIQARDADRARRDAEWVLSRKLAAEREELRQAKLALAAAEKEIALLSTERDLLRAKLDARPLSQN